YAEAKRAAEAERLRQEAEHAKQKQREAEEQRLREEAELKRRAEEEERQRVAEEKKQAEAERLRQEAEHAKQKQREAEEQRRRQPEFWLHRVERKFIPGDQPLVLISFASADQKWVDDLRAFLDPKIELLSDNGDPYFLWNFSDAKRGTA